MPNYMVPARLHRAAAPLPRNPNGKIDRKLLAQTFTALQPPEADQSRDIREPDRAN
jgi:acyl-coenzyme A synthetase/AMP-(fatty) acid ligase